MKRLIFMFDVVIIGLMISLFVTGLHYVLIPMEKELEEYIPKEKYRYSKIHYVNKVVIINENNNKR